MNLTAVKAAAISVAVALLLPLQASAGALDTVALQRQLDADARAWGETVGIAVRDVSTGNTLSVNGGSTFPMASTFKLFLAIALLDAADQGRIRLDEKITVKRADLSLFWQPIEKDLGPDGLTTTLDDLMARAVSQSDNAAADILMRRLGGPGDVEKMLAAKDIRGLRIDRQERDLQTAILGLRWRDDFVDPKLFDAAVAAVHEAQRRAAWNAYLRDPRDSAAPAAVASVLAALAQGKLLSPRSTQRLLQLMRETETGPARLKAGLPAGWALAHKTGSGQEWKGRALTTNDIGIVTAPDGHVFTVAVFLPDSAKTETQRDAFIAGIARVLVTAYR
jgi:beta-lactamase class A